MSKETDINNLNQTKGSVVRPSTKAALSKLGKDIEFARRVRGISIDDFAKAAGISSVTLLALESGNSADISLNTLAMVLTILGKPDLLSNLIDMRNDDIGLSMLRDNVMNGVKSAQETANVSTETLPAKRLKAASGKPVAGTSPAKKITRLNVKNGVESNVKKNGAGNKKSLVASSSGKASSLLGRLKATRDASGS